MEDKFFNMEELMVDYAEMTSFDFESANFVAHVNKKEEYSHQPFTFKYGNYDLVDMLKTMFTKTAVQKG